MQCGQHDEAVKNHPNPKARENQYRSFWEGKSLVQMLLTEGALYENTFIKQDGTWKILVMQYRPQWYVSIQSYSS